MTILQKLDNRISELKKREDLLVTDLDTLRRTIYELEKIRREVTDEEVPEGSEEGFSMQIEEPRQKPRT